jgi:phosphopantothenoylcysteine decarboxylase/phosphopantothenate--cysteine ligase
VSLELVQNPDILKGVQAPGLFKVGFAAETSESLMQVALEKLASKGCNILVANDVSNGAVFGKDTNSVSIVDASGLVATAEGSKTAIAEQLIDIIASRLA